MNQSISFLLPYHGHVKHASIYFIFAFIVFLYHGHIKLSRVSFPVKGLVPFKSSRSHNFGMTFGGICASVKSIFSRLDASNIVSVKYAPAALAFYVLSVMERIGIVYWKRAKSIKK